jgi:hypothetical protein
LKKNGDSFGADEEESFVSYDMQRGTELEPIVFANQEGVERIE